ncbi:MAG: hypothetical protein Kow0062_21430 [Acidobacteriota bacterium]|nr:MAG: hypothetical protein D6738_05640 [Acidobacteriota bacterium]
MTTTQESRESRAGDPRFRVPKVAEPVSVMLEGGLEVEGTVHLAPAAGSHLGRERIIDLLLADEPFLPLTGPDGACLVNKRRIVRIAFADPFDAELDEARGEGTHEAAIEIDLCGVPAHAMRLRGTIRYVMPEGHGRIVDYLNQARRFYPVLTGDRVALVSLKHTVAVRDA